ncbi:MAG TPA: tRNA-dihydrouridine synthase, partial [Kineobactrum sp.]
RAILEAVVAAVPVPVTLKIRTGPAPGSRNGVTIARIAEDAGIAALAVHGRTRACAFRGEAEYDTISAIVNATSFPVFANGDIDSAEKAQAVLAHTGAAGIMVGRAAQGRPWLCGQIAARLATGVTPPPPTIETQLTLLREHVAELHVFYGEFIGVRIARKHVGWYLQHHPLLSDCRSAFNTLGCSDSQLRMIEQFFTRYRAEELAA